MDPSIVILRKRLRSSPGFSNGWSPLTRYVALSYRVILRQSTWLRAVGVI